MSTQARPAPIFKAFDRSGNPLSGGRVTTCEAGTSTLKATFRDAAGAASHTNPIVLDGAGEAAVFWGSGLYKVRVEDAAGALQWEVDGFDPQVIDVPGPSVNLVSNGSFETDTDGDGVPDGWTFTPYTGGSADIDRYDADANPMPDVPHGEAALRFVSPGGAGNGGGYATQADHFEVAEGEDLDVSFWIKASDAGVHNQVDVRWFTSAKAAHATPQTTVYDEAAANPTAWTAKRYRVTPPAGARFAKVRLYGGIDDGVTAGTTRYDHVTVRRVEPQYLRSDEADQVGGVLTFAAAPTLDNNVALLGRTTGGVGRQLACMGDDDVIYLADANHAVRIKYNGTLYAYTGATDHTIWHAGNDGAASGLDADLLDGVQGASLLRSDVADQVDGVLTFTADPTLNNQVEVMAKTTGGTPFGIMQINGSNVVAVGTAALPLELHHNGTLTEVGGGTVWHSGNDGAGSGLDADTVDGLEGAAFGRLIQEVSGRNASGVTVASSMTPVLDVTVGPVAVGQRIVVNAYIKLAKGATAGTTLLTAFPLGAPVACFYGPFDTVDNLLATTTWQPAGELYPVSVSGIYRVVDAQAGFTFRLAALSVGSDGTLAADDAGLLVRVING